MQKWLGLSSIILGNSNDETNFPHKVLLSDKEVARFLMGFANILPANYNIIR